MSARERDKDLAQLITQMGLANAKPADFIII
jgi:hypothetical protein